MAKANPTVEELVAVIERGELRTRLPDEPDEPVPLDYPEAVSEAEDATAHGLDAAAEDAET